MFKFLQNDLIVIHKDLQLVTNLNIQRSSDLDWKNDPSQFIYFANDAC